MVGPKTAGQFMYRTAKKAAKNKKVRRTAQQVYESMAQRKEAGEIIREIAADSTLSDISKLAVELMSGKKSPEGANGLSLLPTTARDVAISGAATGDVTTSVNMYMFKPRRKRAMQGVKYAQIVRWRASSDSQAAEQAVFDIDVLSAVPVLNNPDNNTKYSNLTIKKAFDDFLIAQTQSPNADKLKTQLASIHVSNLTCELEIRNTSATPCTVDVYELVPQHSLGPTTYASETSATGYMSPSWTFTEGLASDTPQLGDTLTSTTVGARPYDSPVFSRTWKQVKRLRLNLTGNSVHRHKSFYEINHTVSYQEYAQFSTSGGRMAGWNPVYCVVHKGFPDATNTLAAPSSITFNTVNTLNYTGFISEGQKAIVFDSNL